MPDRPPKLLDQKCIRICGKHYTLRPSVPTPIGLDGTSALVDVAIPRTWDDLRCSFS